MSLTPQSRRIAFIVAATFFMQVLDGAIITTSLPQMAASFGVDALALSPGITIYMLFAAAGIPLAGWLADRYGSRRVFIQAIILFALASLACGLAQTLWQFVLARAVQGFGAALMTPVGRMVVVRTTEKSRLLEAISTITWPGLTAPVIGPVVGGFITTYFSWRWNFLINLPLGLAGAVLVHRYVPDLYGEARRAFDLKGFLLSSLALTALLGGLESFAHNGALLPALASCSAGLLIGYAALRHLRRVEHPLIDLTPFRLPSFALATISGGLWIRIAVAATPFMLPLLFQVGLGYSAIEAGWFVLAYFAGNLSMKALTTQTLRRFGFRRVIVVNGALTSIAIIALATITADSPVLLVVPLLVFAGSTRSMQFTTLSSLVFADVEDKKQSSASTLSSMFMQLSMVLGVAVATVLLNLSQTLRGAEALGLPDFQRAFITVGLIGIYSLWSFRRLPVDSGAEITGHAPAATANR